MQVVWAHSERETRVLLTDLAPQQIGLGWYGFKALKSVGWQWEHTRQLTPSGSRGIGWLWRLRHSGCWQAAHEWTMHNGSGVRRGD